MNTIIKALNAQNTCRIDATFSVNLQAILLSKISLKIT